MRCIEFLFFFSEFQIWESEFRFLNFSTAEFEKNFLAGIFGIENEFRIPLPLGVPEIGTKNWNSQPSKSVPVHFEEKIMYQYILSQNWCPPTVKAVAVAASETAGTVVAIAMAMAEGLERGNGGR